MKVWDDLAWHHRISAAMSVFAFIGMFTLGISQIISLGQWFPPLVIDHLEEANAHARAGQMEEALTLYKRHVAIVPGDVYALYNIATIYQNTQRWSEARSSWLLALSQNPKERAMVNFMAGFATIHVAELEPDFDRRKALIGEAGTLIDASVQGGYNVDPGVLRSLAMAKGSVGL